jgi:DNA-binding transcriptional ArsR family regulator
MYDLQEITSIERLVEEQAKFCSVFSNARRIQILWALGDRELSVGAIAEAVGSSLQNVSQHLSRMKDYNIVSSRREGQTIYYRIERETLIARCLSLLRANASEVRSEDQ